jgi:hypothetical protein
MTICFLRCGTKAISENQEEELQFQAAKSALKACTHRGRREIFNWINDLIMTLIRVLVVHTKRQAETARRLAVETWLRRNGVITVTQNEKVLLVFLEQFAQN